MGRTLGATFIAEKNADFNRPFYSAKFAFGGAVGNVYVADSDIVIGGNFHHGICENWGEINYAMEPREGSFSLVQTHLDLINHRLIGAPVKRFSDLFAGIGVAGVEVSVYQNFWTPADPNLVVQDLLHDFVMRPRHWDRDTASIDLVSIAEKFLDKNEVAYVLNQTDTPQIDPAEVGKRANVLYGTFKKMPAHPVKTGRESTLRAAMTTASTVVPITDDFYDYLVAASITSGSVWVGSEKIDWTAKGGAAGARTLSGLTRNSSSTPLEEHHQDDTLIEVVNEWIYLLADQPMGALTQVWFKRGKKIVPVAAAGYTAELANTTLVSGRTMSLVKFTTPPVIAEKELVTVSVSGGPTEVQHQQSGVDQSASTGNIASGGSINLFNPASFPAQAFTKSSGNFDKTMTLTVDAISGAPTRIDIITDGVTTTAMISPVVGQSVTINRTGANFWSMVVQFINTTGGGIQRSATISLGGKKCTYNIAAPPVTGSLPSTSTAEKPLVDAVLFDGEGYKDDGSGTYTGAANALIERCADVAHHVARVRAAMPSARVDAASFAQARADSPSTDKFSGNIVDETGNAKTILLKLGIQGRMKIDLPVDKLTCQFLKTTYPVPGKIIKATSIVPGSLKTRLGDVKELLNTIELRYGRTWFEAKSEKSFQKVSKGADAPSIADYGVLKDERRFLYELIAADNDAMANALRDFRLARFKGQPRIVELEAYLDQYEVLTGDVVGIEYFLDGEHFDGLTGAQKFLIEAVNHVPGALARGDLRRLKLILREVA